MTLNNNLGPRADDAYALLLEAHDGLTTSDSHALNARLILILMNEVGDTERLKTLIESARRA